MELRAMKQDLNRHQTSFERYAQKAYAQTMQRFKLDMKYKIHPTQPLEQSVQIFPFMKL